MLWSRKAPQPPADRTKLVGLDLNAGRARAVACGGGRTRAVLLDDPAEELALAVSLERRHPEVGRAGVAACRRLPHLVCANFLPLLGQPKEWRGSRVTLTPESALAAVFEKIRPAVTAESDALGLVLPAYLSPAQVKAVAAAAQKARLPLRGSASAPVAIAAHRAAAVLAAKAPPPADPAPDGGRPDWVVPLRVPAGGPGAAVVIDADEYALSAAAVQVDPGEVHLVAAGYWPRASVKAWKDRLVDALSDRCVRVCRRDPRDSAEAEQALFEQLDPALDRARHGQPVTVTVRAAHWYQDLHLQPGDFDAACGGLVKAAVDGVREVFGSASLPVPPRVVWLTHAAARLPGLAAAVYQNCPEQTAVAMLPPAAGAEAAAALLARWLAGGLSPGHLDVAIPLQPSAGGSQPSAEQQRSGGATRR